MIQKIALEITKNGNSYQFVCAIGSPLGEMHDVLFELKEIVLDKMAQVQKEDMERGSKIKQMPTEEAIGETNECQ